MEKQLISFVHLIGGRDEQRSDVLDGTMVEQHRLMFWSLDTHIIKCIFQ